MTRGHVTVSLTGMQWDIAVRWAWALGSGQAALVALNVAAFGYAEPQRHWHAHYGTGRRDMERGLAEPGSALVQQFPDGVGQPVVVV